MTLPHFHNEAGLPETRNGFSGQFQIGRVGFDASVPTKLKLRVEKKEQNRYKSFLFLTLERCPSGRRSSTGNAVTGLNPFGGSNPPLSVFRSTKNRAVEQVNSRAAEKTQRSTNK
jgi:hypothetical protein